MKEIKKILIPSNCNCTKQQIILELSFPLEKKYLPYFNNNNLTEVKSYINSGILYIENANLIAIGPFGSNRLQIKCKNSSCDASLADFENVLKNIP